MNQNKYSLDVFVRETFENFAEKDYFELETS